jgi:hypothetical protein
MALTSDFHGDGIDLHLIIEPKLKRFLQVGPKAMAWALADAMTSAGKDSQEHLQRVTPQYVDKPTRYTLSSIGRWPGYVKPPGLSQWIGFKATRGGATSHYLEPMVYGGPRPQKRSEERLNSAGIRERFLMPTGLSPARLNQYGNITGGTYVMILSQLKAFNLAGYTANASRSARSLAKRKKRPFFVQSLQGINSSKAPAAVFARVGRRKIRPVFTLTNSQPRYDRRFPVPEILEVRYRQRFSAALSLYLQRKLDKMAS